jgi:AcrR family transcriptional regulator
VVDESRARHHQGVATVAAHSPTNSRKLAAEKTRAALLEAGMVLAESTGLDGLTVNALVEAAGVSKGTFFHHFHDRTSYVVALHRQFHDVLGAQVREAVAGIEPGPERLVRISKTYLDACLRDRGVKALVVEARSSMLIVDEARRRNAVNVGLIAEDFAAMGAPHPRSAARLWIAANAEAALVELELGRRDKAIRDAVVRLTHP